LIIHTRRRVIIVTSLIVGALILALMLWIEPIVGVDKVEVLLGLGIGIAQMSNISTDFAKSCGNPWL
jgi:type IV secretory pathway TrbD component